MTINCIGDSHISTLTGQSCILETGHWKEYPGKRILHVGPLTAFNTVEKGDLLNICKGIHKDEYILLSFGEIDCRCRVGRESVPVDNLELIVQRYFEFIKSIGNNNIILLAVTPCIVEKPMGKWFEEDPARDEIFVATRGTMDDRNKFKGYFNMVASAICEAKGYHFLNLWGDVLGNREMYLDDIHLDGNKVNYFLEGQISNICK